MESLRCLIAAGGTAGHVQPALAIADALSERGVAVTFAGTSGRAEARLVPDAGYELDTFAVAGIPRRVGPASARAALLAVSAPLACRRIIERRRPDVVLGAGGYVAGPMVLAAWTKRVPAALTEADAHLGLANRLAAPFARRIFLSFPIDGRDAAKYLVTGRPARFEAARVPRDEARARFGLPADGPVVLVFGGSQGAQALNEFAVGAFADVDHAVLHIAGERYVDALRPRVTRAGYRLFGYVDDFGAALAAADIAVARAGGSIWDLAAAGLPAVLVPSPNVTADHQTKNARHFERGGGAVVVPEPELSMRGADVVRGLLDDPVRRGAMADAMRALARPEAADLIAKELITLADAARR